MNESLTNLREYLENRFSLEDIKTLCFDLSVDFDNLEGQTKSAKARELILHFSRIENILQLANKIREVRPSKSIDLIFKTIAANSQQEEDGQISQKTNSNVLSYSYDEPFIFLIEIGEDQTPILNDEEILALTEEAVFALTYNRQIIVEVYVKKIDHINQLIADFDKRINLDATERQHKVDQMYAAKQLEQKKDTLQTGLKLLFQFMRSLVPPGFSFAKVDKIAKIIQRLAERSFFPQRAFSDRGLRIQIIHKKDRDTFTTIILDEEESDKLRSRVKNKFDWIPYPDVPDVIVNMPLMNGSFNIFDLEESAIINKAIPTLVTFTVWAYLEQKSISETGFDKYLNIHNWFIGLA